MQIHLRAAAAAALILFASVSVVFAQGRGGGQRGGGAAPDTRNAAWRGNAKVDGKVIDEAGKPIENVKVAFVFVSSNSGFFATTKKNGEFSAKDIKAGDWRIVVESPNFITLRQPIAIVDSKSAPLLPDGTYAVVYPAATPRDADLAMEAAKACDDDIVGAVKIIARGMDVLEKP